MMIATISQNMISPTCVSGAKAGASVLLASLHATVYGLAFGLHPLLLAGPWPRLLPANPALISLPPTLYS